MVGIKSGNENPTRNSEQTVVRIESVTSGEETVSGQPYWNAYNMVRGSKTTNEITIDCIGGDQKSAVTVTDNLNDIMFGNWQVVGYSEFSDKNVSKSSIDPLYNIEKQYLDEIYNTRLWWPEITPQEGSEKLKIL